MIGKPATADVYTDFSALTRLRGQAKSDSPEALREAARQFESIFLQMALKSMRQAGIESNLLNTQQTKIYRDLYDQQMSLELAKRTQLGLAAMLERQLGGKTAQGGASVSGKRLDDYRRDALPVMTRGGIASALNKEHDQALRLIDRITQASPPPMPSHPAESTSRFTGPEDFVARLWPEAQKAGQELGVDPKLLLAQAALESGWGKFIPYGADGRSSHNLFGIKADRHWVGRSIASSTLEYEGGVAFRTRTAFRAYDTYADSFRDYVQFLRANARYAQALEHADDPARFVASLQKAGYATDPAYARKVLSIYHDHAAFEGLNAV